MEKLIDKEIRENKRKAWKEYRQLMDQSKEELLKVFETVRPMTQNDVNFGLLHNNTESLDDFSLRELMQNARRGILGLGRFPVSVRQPLTVSISNPVEASIF